MLLLYVSAEIKSWNFASDPFPLGSIDFLAPKSGQNSWFLSTLDALKNAYPQMRLDNYPGLAYAKALCIRGLEEENSEVSIQTL